MKHILSHLKNPKAILFMGMAVVLLIIGSCNGGGGDPPTPEKTLNKSLLTNKYWENASFTHYFRSDGKYGETIVLGTWQWLNNSDSLEIVDFTTGTEIWYFKYCTATEMSAKLGKNSGYMIFTIKK